MLLFLSSFFHDSVEETGEKGQKSCNIDPKISREIPVETCEAERRAINTSNFGSKGPGFTPRPSRCFRRQGTLLPFVPLYPGVCVPATYCSGVTLRWTSIPSGGGVE